MEKSAKRLSSVFSLGSTSSGKSNDSRTPTLRTPQESRTTSPSRLTYMNTSTLQPSASSPDLRTSITPQFPQLDPAFDPTYPTLVLGNSGLPPGISKPLPLPPGSLRAIRPGSVAGSRPGSPPKNFSRPTSSDGSRATSPSRQFIYPIAQASENSRPSRPPSRVGLTPTSRPSSRTGLTPISTPISPVKHLSRPTTPTTEKRLSKRRSWLPGRSKHDSADEGEGAHAPPHAWELSPNQQRPYDVSPLLNFQKVSAAATSMEDDRILTVSIRSRSFGMSAGILSSTFTRTCLVGAHPFGLTQICSPHQGNCLLLPMRE